MIEVFQTEAPAATSLRLKPLSNEEIPFSYGRKRIS